MEEEEEEAMETSDESFNEDVSLRLEMHGGILDSALPVHLAVSALGETQSLFDKSFLVLTSKGKVTKELRNKFYLEVTELKRGSLIATLGIAFSGLQPTLPVLGELGPKGVFDLVKNSYSFLKLILTATSKGIPVTITQNGDGNTSNVVIGDNNTITNNNIIYCARESLPVYERIADKARKNGIDSYLIKDIQHDSTLELTQNDFEILGKSTKISSDPVIVNAEIFDLDKFDREGWISIKSHETIAPGNYRFKIIGDQDMENYIDSMKAKAVKLNCLLEMHSDPLRPEKISRLQIIGVLQ